MKIATAVWRPWLPWAWAALSATGAMIAFLTAFVVVVTIDSWWMSSISADEQRLDLALWLFGWAGLSMAGVAIAGRLVFRRWIRVGWSAVVPATAGVALAAAVELVLHAWAYDRFSSVDPDLIGWTAGLPFALVPTSVALFGVLIAPRGSVGPPMVVLVVMAGLAAFIAANNVSGALDGIEPDSWALAVLIGLAGAYAIGAVALGVRRLRLG